MALFHAHAAFGVLLVSGIDDRAWVRSTGTTPFGGGLVSPPRRDSFEEEIVPSAELVR